MGTRPFVRPAGALVVALAAAAAPVRAQQRTEIVIEVPRAADRRRIEAELALAGATIVDELAALGLLLVAYPDGEDVESAIARAAALPGVGFVEPNGQGAGGDFVPNDTFLGEQWPLRNTGQSGGLPGADVEALPAWELTRGSPGVIVAVLDSGLVLDHPEFAGRVLPGFDFVAQDDDPSDDNGHGTFVTGILAAAADNAFGLAGIAHGCTLLPVKILNRHNTGSSFDFAQGLTYAADGGSDVINMSLINYPSGDTLRAAVNYASDAGCVLVACAGNGGVGDADRSFPGRSPRTISVGATDRNDARASYSGTGTSLDLVAPGHEVPATWIEPIDTWTFFYGCSAATPVVSGIAALARSLDPALTHAEIRALLETGAEDGVGPPSEDTPGRDDFFGHGRANLLRTLCALDGGAPTIAAPASAQIECPVPGGLAGDDPLVAAVLAAVIAIDDLDPAPELGFTPPAFLPLGEVVPVLFTARDACGNESEHTLQLAAVDTRSPTLGLVLLVERLVRQQGLLVPVGLRAKVSDACDPAPVLELSVHADEPPGPGEPDALLDPAGNLALRCERDPAGDGRVYLCLVRARDASGNAALECVTVVVPRDPAPASLADVLRQAERAAAVARLTGAPPDGFHDLLEANPALTAHVPRPTASR